MKKKITLIIVDCQYDFIEGTLAVKGAREAINNIISFINIYKNNIENVIFTVDWHPTNHCSFMKNGGLWPIHCVNYTKGAGIDDSLIEAVERNQLMFNIYKKGADSNKEQYGAFEESILKDSFIISDNIVMSKNTDFIVCGIAGDYCVKESINNLLTNVHITPKILLFGIASIDDGTTIKNFIEENKLEIVK